ncbi:unnamed protein product [Amoebophrya sp. A120]|nr:unnamed protein product [Amoebophrya sp. A120]|eukprot:GSA120T00013849001.1
MHCKSIVLVSIEDLQDLTEALVAQKAHFFADAMSLESQKDVQQKVLTSGMDEEQYPISLLQARCAGVATSKRRTKGAAGRKVAGGKKIVAQKQGTKSTLQRKKSAAAAVPLPVPKPPSPTSSKPPSPTGSKPPSPTTSKPPSPSSSPRGQK